MLFISVLDNIDRMASLYLLIYKELYQTFLVEYQNVCTKAFKNFKYKFPHLISMKHLHPGARWQFRFTVYMIIIILSLFIVWFIVPAIAFLFYFLGGELSAVAIILSVLVYLFLILIIGEVYARMSYNRWFYEFTDGGLRLERGIIWKRYSNIPYERIQNVDVHRGIIARMFGFSSVLIQTAGYSAHPYAEGYIPALDINQAEQIRTFVMKKITNRRK